MDNKHAGRGKAQRRKKQRDDAGQAHPAQLATNSAPEGRAGQEIKHVPELIALSPRACYEQYVLASRHINWTRFPGRNGEYKNHNNKGRG